MIIKSGYSYLIGEKMLALMFRQEKNIGFNFRHQPKFSSLLPDETLYRHLFLPTFHFTETDTGKSREASKIRGCERSMASHRH